MYMGEIINFSRAGLKAPNLLGIAKIHKTKLKKKLQDQSTFRIQKRNIKCNSRD